VRWGAKIERARSKPPARGHSGLRKKKEGSVLLLVQNWGRPRCVKLVYCIKAVTTGADGAWKGMSKTHSVGNVQSNRGEHRRGGERVGFNKGKDAYRGGRNQKSWGTVRVGPKKICAGLQKN